ncbi:MAG: site-specific DNA-methyltransferase [Chloroflexi bacterium]|nr:MAG: site-specific DNA-methyltransferase [Chloroflexota bacterium]
MVERFDPLGEQTSEVSENLRGLGGNLLFHGDNKDVLAWLLTHGYRGKVNLVYIDPPFDSGADYVRRVQLRGIRRTAKLEGEAHGLSEQIQYTDIWANDAYLQFMYERLLLLKELLTEDGSIYLHCDWRKGHHLRCVMDEVFGAERHMNEIVWKRTSARSDSRTFNHIHDLIFLYSKGDSFQFNQLFLPHNPDYIARYYTYTEPDGRRFATIDATQAGLRRGLSGTPWRGFNPASKGNHWKFAPRELDRLDSEERIYWPKKAGGWPRLKSYLDEVKGVAIQSIWTDIKTINSQAAEREDYPTQKPESLLNRIIRASSNPGDLVLDCFIGSGTTAAVAQKLGRRWIAADVNKGAIQTTSKRLQAIIRQQVEAGAVPQQMAFETQTSEVSEDLGGLAGLTHSFSVYRVNDYDLQIQHNEAVNLAVEMIGIERVKTDAFFDGTLGRRLVKIVPFNHPLTLLDLQLAQDELKARPDEERDVVLVCLGKETSVDAWLAEYNKRRPVNKIEVIELRTDQKYGKFFIHQPAQARVRVERQTSEVSEDLGGLLVIEIEDFISPSIVERLEMDTPLFKAQIPDWRAMVDVVLIDTAYDGQTFNIVLSDVPERKNDLVSGRYELPAPEGVAPGSATTVAVKIIDMLGEEVLVTAEVGPA